jgi:hypothetical protein
VDENLLHILRKALIVKLNSTIGEEQLFIIFSHVPYRFTWRIIVKLPVCAVRRILAGLPFQLIYNRIKIVLYLFFSSSLLCGYLSLPRRYLFFTTWLLRRYLSLPVGHVWVIFALPFYYLFVT